MANMSLKIEEIESSGPYDMIDITARVQSFISESSCRNGLICIFAPHTTAGITINENADPAVKADMMTYFKRHFPNERHYTHSEGNSPAHILSSMVSASLTLIIDESFLLLGRWQSIYFCEFDGPRRRKIYMKIFFDA